MDGRRGAAHAGIALAFVLAALVRLAGLGAESLWFDEAFSVAAATRPPRELVETLVADGRQAPLSFFVLKVCLAALAGAPLELAARLPSLVASLVELWLAWRLGRLLAGERAALLGAALLALAQLSVRQAQEARMYALASCLVCAAAFCFALALLEGRARALLGAGLFGGLALLTHYWCAFPLAALVAWGFAARRSRPLPARECLAAASLCALVVAPWLACAGSEQLGTARALLAAGAPEWGKVGWRTIFLAPALLAGAEQPRLGPAPAPWAIAGAWLLLLAPAIVAAGGALRSCASSLERVRLAGLASLAFLPLLLALAAGLCGAQFAVRYLLPSLAPLCLLAARGLLLLRPRPLRLAAIAAALAFSLAGTVAVWRGGWKPAWRPLVHELASRAEAEDCVLWLPGGVPPLQWGLYAPGREPPRALPPALEGLADCTRLWLVSFAPSTAHELERERARRALLATHAPGFVWSEPPLLLELHHRR